MLCVCFLLTVLTIFLLCNMLYVISVDHFHRHLHILTKLLHLSGHLLRLLAGHFVALCLPTLLTLYMSHLSLLFFLPIMGRVGSFVLPDAAVAVMIALPIIVISGFSVSSSFYRKLSLFFLFIIDLWPFSFMFLVSFCFWLINLLGQISDFWTIFSIQILPFVLSLGNALRATCQS